MVSRFFKLYKTTFALNSLLNFLLDVDIKFLFKEENTILSYLNVLF